MFEPFRKYLVVTIFGISSIVAGLYLLLIYVPSQISSSPVLTGILCTTQTQMQNNFDGWISIGVTLILGGIVLFLVMLFFCCNHPDYEKEIKTKNEALKDFMANLDEILYKGKIVFSVVNKKKYPPLRYITVQYLDKNYILDIKEIHVQDKWEKNINEENN